MSTDTEDRTEADGVRPEREITQSRYARVATEVHHRGSRGERAVLRRLALHSASPPAEFWEALGRAGMQPEAFQDQEFDFWMGILPVMARHPHEGRAYAGRLLARARVSSSRVERWLRRDRRSALGELSRLVSKLPAGEGLNWTQMGRLLHGWSVEDRRRFAADYFAEYRRLEKSNRGED